MVAAAYRDEAKQHLCSGYALMINCMHGGALTRRDAACARLYAAAAPQRRSSTAGARRELHTLTVCSAAYYAHVHTVSVSTFMYCISRASLYHGSTV